MAENEFEYKGKKYTLKPLKNSLLNSAMPVIMAEQRLTEDIMKDIDDSLRVKYLARLQELNFALKNYEDKVKNNVKLTKEQVKHKNSLSKTRAEFVKEMSENEDLKRLVEVIESRHSLKMLNIATDVCLMQPFLTSVLEGDFSNVDFDDADMLAFNLTVLNTFFFSIILNKLKFQG